MAQASDSSAPQLSGELCQKPALLGAVLILATLLLYAPVAHHEFLEYDDSQYVTKNLHVRTGLNLSNVVWGLTNSGSFYWHPLTWLSHMADCQMFGLNPGAHHIINALLHAANVLILFVLLQQATGAVGRSFLVASLFAVHPLNVETVAWVAERKSLLSALFSLITVAAYGWYVRQPNGKKYMAVLAAFSLALMSKPMAVTLPLVLLLLDYWPLNRYEELPFRRRWARLSLEKLPLMLMSVASSVATLAGQRSAAASLSDLSLSIRLQNALTSYVAYIGKMLWPARLAVLYPHARHSLSWVEIIASVTILVGITTLVLRFRRARYLVTGWLLFVITLIPVIGIVQVGMQAMADRFAYISCIGLFIIVAWFFGDLAETLSLTWTVPAVASVCLVLAFATASSHYLQYWQDGVKLFTRARTVAGKPDSEIEELLADALVAAGRVDEALEHYRQSCALSPTYALCHYNTAEILFARYQLRNALDEYQLAGRFTDSKDMAVSCLNNSGEILSDLGDYDAAEKEFAAALNIDPANHRATQLRERTLYRKSTSIRNR